MTFGLGLEYFGSIADHSIQWEMIGQTLMFLTNHGHCSVMKILSGFDVINALQSKVREWCALSRDQRSISSDSSCEARARRMLSTIRSRSCLEILDLSGGSQFFIESVYMTKPFKTLLWPNISELIRTERPPSRYCSRSRPTLSREKPASDSMTFGLGLENRGANSNHLIQWKMIGHTLRFFATPATTRQESALKL